MLRKKKSISCSTTTIDAEGNQDIFDRALRDTIHIICKFVDIKTLNTIAAVCDYWYRAASHEKDKRYCIKRLRFPYEIGKPGVGNKLDWHLYSPLLIYNSSLENSLSVPVEEPQNQSYRARYASNGLEEELLEHFDKQLPNKVIIMKVSEFFTGDDAEQQSVQGQCDQKSRPGNCNILGLFLPKMEQIHVDVASVRLKHCDPRYWDVAQFSMQSYKFCRRDFNLMDRLTRKLRLNDCKYSRARKKGKEITLGTVMGAKMSRNGSHRRNSLAGWFNRNGLLEWCFKVNKCVLIGVVMRISGPTVESWSTFMHYKSNRDEIERKLLELKRKATRKQHCTGLFFAPKCPQPGCMHVNHPCGDSQAMMSTLNRIFPGIRFVATFEDFEQYEGDDPPVFTGEDELDENDFRIGLELNRKVSVIIISHD